MKPFEGIAQITSTVATKSVLNPTLILAAIVVPIGLVLALKLEGNPQELVLWLVAAVILVALLQIVGFSILSPLHLQDNRHVEERLRIEHLAKLGDSHKEIIIDAESVPVNNPAVEDRRDV